MPVHPGQLKSQSGVIRDANKVTVVATVVEGHRGCLKPEPRRRCPGKSRRYPGAATEASRNRPGSSRSRPGPSRFIPEAPRITPAAPGSPRRRPESPRQRPGSSRGVSGSVRSRSGSNPARSGATPCLTGKTLLPESTRCGAGVAPDRAGATTDWAGDAPATRRRSPEALGRSPVTSRYNILGSSTDTYAFQSHVSWISFWLDFKARDFLAHGIPLILAVSSVWEYTHREAQGTVWLTLAVVCHSGIYVLPLNRHTSRLSLSISHTHVQFPNFKYCITYKIKQKWSICTIFA